MLNSHVDLGRARGLVVGSEQTVGEVYSAIEVAGHNIVWVGVSKTERVGRLVLLLQSRNRRSHLAKGKLIAIHIEAAIRRRDGWLAGAGELGYRSENARDRGLQERAGLEPQRTVKQHVVENHVLAGFPRVPGNPQVGAKVLVRVRNGSTQVRIIRKHIIELGYARQIAVGAPGIANVAKAEVDREVGEHLPGIGYVQSQTVIRPQSARGIAKRRLGRRKPLTVAQDDDVNRVVQGVTSATGIWASSGKGGIGGKNVSCYLRRQGEELGETSTLNVVEVHAVAQDVLAQGL